MSLQVASLPRQSSSTCFSWQHRWTPPHLVAQPARPQPLLLWCMLGSRTRHPAACPCSQAPCRDRPALSSWPDPAPSPALCCELLLPVVLPGGFPLDPHCSAHCADALRWVHAPGWHVAPGDRRPLSVPCTRGDAGSWDTGAAITCPGIRCEHNAQGRGSPPVRAGVQL